MKKKREALSPVEEETFPPKRAARYLGLKSSDVLRVWRAAGEGPPYFRSGKRLIMYRRRDLDQWIESRVVLPEARKLA